MSDRMMQLRTGEWLPRQQAPEPEALRYAKTVRVSEYTNDVARAAKECLPELKELLRGRTK